MKTTHRVVDGASGLDAAERVLLLQAAMRAGRQVAGGVAHDLISSLQCLGDALYVLREEMGRQAPTPRADPAFDDFTMALDLADAAFVRLCDTTRTVPNLVPGLADETGPIDLAAELRAVVATTRHHWRGRLEISVESKPEAAPFWCTWWIARVAVQRMLLLAIDAQQSTPANERSRSMRLRMIGSREGDEVEVRVVLDVPPADGASGGAGAVGVGLDSVLCLCATHLHGEVAAEFATAFDIAFRFPVRSAPTTTPLPFR